MLLHPALENLIKSVNSDKTYNKENLTKWCSSLPKEEKDFFTAKIKENVSRDELVKILQGMKQPGPKPEGVPQPTPKKNVPTVYKKGDVLMHPVFQHPYILLEKKDEFWLCALITSEPTCPETFTAVVKLPPASQKSIGPGLESAPSVGAAFTVRFKNGAET